MRCGPRLGGAQPQTGREVTEDIAGCYDTGMKKIIFLLLLGAVGFVAYKYFSEESY